MSGVINSAKSRNSARRRQEQAVQLTPKRWEANMFNANAESLSVHDVIGFNGISKPMLSLNEEMTDKIEIWLRDQEELWRYIWNARGSRAIGIIIDRSLLSAIARNGNDEERAAARWLWDVQAREGKILF